MPKTWKRVGNNVKMQIMKKTTIYAIIGMVVLGVSGAFIAKANFEKRGTQSTAYFKSSSGACIQITSGSNAFTPTGNLTPQARIRDGAGTLYTLYANSNCDLTGGQTVEFDNN